MLILFVNILIELKGQLKTLIQKIVNPNTEYTSVKFRGVIYKIGDFIIINDAVEDFSIAKLLKIIPNNGSETYYYWPTIEVQWYYRKRNIHREKNNLVSKKKYNSISEYEVFKSEHKDRVFIESILSKCSVLSFEEYELLEDVTSTVFFCRYGYDPFKKMLVPPFEKWKKACKCHLPLNPEQLYISCEKCKEWYHPECCGLETSDLEKIEFVCHKCS